jgi:MFS family permease
MTAPVRPAPISLWRHAAFGKLWVGKAVSGLGSQVSAVAIPLTAVYYLHASAWQVGLLTAFGSIAYLLIGLPTGPYVDRHRKRPIMLVANLGRTVALASVPLAAAFSVLTLGQLCAVALIVGLLGVPFGVAYQSYLPELIDARALLDGGAKMQATNSINDIVGPGLAGVLIAALTAPIAVAVDAISYLVSAAMIHSISAADETEPPPLARRR